MIQTFVPHSIRLPGRKANGYARIAGTVKAAAVSLIVTVCATMLCTGCGSSKTLTYERGNDAVPDNAEVTYMDYADVYEYTQELENITIKSREFLYANGDVFWHDKLRMDEDSCKQCKYSIEYDCQVATVTYYDDDTSAWVIEEPLKEGELPYTDMFINTDGKNVLLNLPFLYTDLGCGTVRARDELRRPIKVIKTETGYRFEMTFKYEKETWGEIWALESEEELVDFDNQTMRLIWPGYRYSINSRWLMDGYYFTAYDSYKPYAKNAYWKNPAAYIPSNFVNTGGSRAANDLGFAQLYIGMRNMCADGYFKSLPRSGWLYTDYDIGYGFYDTRFNTDVFIAYINAYKFYGEQEFLNSAERYAEFFKAFSEKHCFEFTGSDGKIGWLVQDYWHDSEDYTPTHSSLNHHLQEIIFLYNLEAVNGDASLAELADKMVRGVELTCEDWIKKNNDLHYGYWGDGTYRRDDYPNLTYNDMFNLQKLLESRGTGRNTYLQRLMDVKKEYMDANGIMGYKK